MSALSWELSRTCSSTTGHFGRRALGRQVALMTAAINYLPLDGCNDERQQRVEISQINATVFLRVLM